MTYLKQAKFQLGIVVLLTIFVYGNSLFGNFVWDDHLFLETWPDVQNFNIKGIFSGSAPQEQGNVYRPVRGLLWAIDLKVFGANPFLYHLQALLIHLASTVLVYFLAKLLIQLIKADFSITSSFPRKRESRNWIPHQVRDDKREIASSLATLGTRNDNLRWLPFIVALIFGIHPIHTETIDYISASMETWGSLSFFGSLTAYFWAKSVQSSKFKVQSYVVSVVLAILAFFTYEMTLTLPLLLVLADMSFPPFASLRVNSRESSSGFSIKSRMTAWWAPYFVAAGVFVFIRVIVLGVLSRTDYLAYSFYHTMLVMVKVIVRYILLLFVPYNQTAIHNLAGDFPSSMIPYDKLDPILAQTIFDLPVLAAILVIGILVLLAIRYRREFPLASFGMLWFFITLLPVSYIIPHGGAMAEKYLYIPSFGFILAAASLACELYKYMSFPRKRESRTLDLGSGSRIKFGMTGREGSGMSRQVLIYLGVALMVFYSVSTIVRNRVWKNDITLFSDVVSQSPNNLLANYTLGIWYGRAGDLDGAVQYYNRVIDLAAEFWEARFNLANVFVRQGEFDKAAEQYKIVYEINPNNIAAKNILANLPLIKESTSSAQTEQLVVNYNTKVGLKFDFPAFFAVVDDGKEVKITDAGSSMSIEIARDELLKGQKTEDYLKSTEGMGSTESTEGRGGDLGTIVQEGQAGIPGFDAAWVRVWSFVIASPAESGVNSAKQSDSGQSQNDEKKIATSSQDSTRNDKQELVSLQFFLFKGSDVVKVLISPAPGSGDVPIGQKNIVDAILGSISIE